MSKVIGELKPSKPLWPVNKTDTNLHSRRNNRLIGNFLAILIPLGRPHYHFRYSLRVSENYYEE